MGPLRGGGVAVHAGYPGPGKHSLDGFLKLLGSDPVAVDAAAPAGRALKRDRNAHVAVMTDQDALAGMVRQGDGAVQAAEDMAAVQARQERVEAPAVEEEERLLPCAERVRDGLPEHAGKDRHASSLIAFRPHVDDLDRGQGPVLHATGKAQAAVSPSGAVQVALQGRRGRPEHNGSPVKLRLDEGQVPGVVPHAVVLLVGSVVLLVHDDQPQVLNGREQGGAGAGHDPDLSPANFSPLVEAGAARYAAVQDGDLPIRKAFPAPAEELRGQGDFRHQKNDAAALHGLTNGLKVHLRLSAPRHPVKQIGGEPAAGDSLSDLLERRPLIFVEPDRPVPGADRRVHAGAAVTFPLLQEEHSFLHEASDQGGGAFECPPEDGQRDGAGRADGFDEQALPLRQLTRKGRPGSQ
ncbi:MAG: hypothetical protein A4E68_02413 [Syntrophaceae bacterium PtaB.Bin095]|nr:MAG: hypothetical protein A4E68_02413 [Syntrophaceae bacterium PtaB.Bin095]